MQNGDHSTSLCLLDSLTAPSAFTNPGTRRVYLLKWSSTTRAFSGPSTPLLLFRVYRSKRCSCSISAKPRHGITSFTHRFYSRLKSITVLSSFRGMTSKTRIAQLIGNAYKYDSLFGTSQQKLRMQPTDSRAYLSDSAIKIAPTRKATQADE